MGSNPTADIFSKQRNFCLDISFLGLEGVSAVWDFLCFSRLLGWVLGVWLPLFLGIELTPEE